MSKKQTTRLKEDSTTNGPQGTVSQETQASIELLLNSVKSLMSKVTNANPNYKDTVDIESEELVIGKLIMSRRQVKVWTRFDV